jgi:hypothetical protein
VLLTPSIPARRPLSRNKGASVPSIFVMSCLRSVLRSSVVWLAVPTSIDDKKFHPLTRITITKPRYRRTSAIIVNAGSRRAFAPQPGCAPDFTIARGMPYVDARRARARLRRGRCGKSATLPRSAGRVAVEAPSLDLRTAKGSRWRDPRSSAEHDGEQFEAAERDAVVPLQRAVVLLRPQRDEALECAGAHGMKAATNARRRSRRAAPRSRHGHEERAEESPSH